MSTRRSMSTRSNTWYRRTLAHYKDRPTVASRVFSNERTHFGCSYKRTCSGIREHVKILAYFPRTKEHVLKNEQWDTRNMKNEKGSDIDYETMLKRGARQFEVARCSVGSVLEVGRKYRQY